MRTIYTFSKVMTLALLCSLLFVQSSDAQSLIQTPIYSRVNATIGGYYEALPPDYASNPSKRYPLLVFLHGVGEIGDGSPAQLSKVLANGPPKLINNGTFPATFTVNGQTFSFIVISPQYASNDRNASTVQSLITYMVQKYRVDSSRIYLTGLSMGGGICWIYGGWKEYEGRLAAMSVVAGATDASPGLVGDYVQEGLPIWAFHNQNDPTVPVTYTTDWITQLNGHVPPINPPAIGTIFPVSGHDAWTQAYDPNYRENGKNVYEWMLSYTRKGVAPANQPPVANAGPDQTITLPTSSVTLSGSGTDADGTIKSYSWSKTAGPSQYSISSTTVSNPTVSNLVAGTYTFQLTVTDNLGATGTDNVNIIVNSAPSSGGSGSSGKKVQVNIYDGSVSYNNAAWNNWNLGTGAGTNVSDNSLKYTDGTASGITVALSQNTKVVDNGAAYVNGWEGGMAPAEVLRFTSYSNALRTLTFSGLSTSKKYIVELYASRASNAGNSTYFYIGSSKDTVSTFDNYSNEAIFKSLTPDATGKIAVSIDPLQEYSYLNGFAISEDTSSGSSQSVSSKFIKVNVYDGVNPSTDVQWNNWNVGAPGATNINSATLKYSDGTASTVSVGISQSTDVADNGSAYTGTIAPAAVLRYASYSTLKRTLTLSGLSSSKKYDIELYAARNKNSGNNTVFAIGSLSKSIATYDNVSTKATFQGIAPDATGKIVVNVSATAEYNYLNGFMITEGSSSSVATVNASTLTTEGAAITPEQGLEGDETTLFRIFPNPVQDAFVLQLNNAQTGNLRVQVLDVNGIVRRDFSFSKSQHDFSTTLSLGNLPKGNYIIRAQIKDWSDVIKILRL